MPRTWGSITSGAISFSLFFTLHVCGWYAYDNAAVESRVTTFLAGSSLLGTLRCFWSFISLTSLTRFAARTTSDEEDAIGDMMFLIFGIPIDISVAVWGFWVYRDEAALGLIPDEEHFLKATFYMHLWMRCGAAATWCALLMLNSLTTWATLQQAEYIAGNFERGPLTERLLFVTGRITKLSKRPDRKPLKMANRAARPLGVTALGVGGAMDVIAYGDATKAAEEAALREAEAAAQKQLEAVAARKKALQAQKHGGSGEAKGAGGM